MDKVNIMNDNFCIFFFFPCELYLIMLCISYIMIIMKKKGINYNLISVMSNREIKEDSVLLIGPVVMHVKLTIYIMYLPFFWV